MNVHLLINGIVQQTMVLIAQLATAGGMRAPLAQVANQVFLDLTSELQRQGVRKKVIADMFGMALRTYHRRERQVSESQTERGRTVWDAVLGYIRSEQPVSGWQVAKRFQYDDPRTVSGVLHDMARSGFVYRTGEGDHAVYRVAEPVDLNESLDNARKETTEHLVWLAVYREGPIDRRMLADIVRLEPEEVEVALGALAADGRIRARQDGVRQVFDSDRLDVPVGATGGWEAAVLDHFQAVVATFCQKIGNRAPRAEATDAAGGATFTFDVWPGHPLDAEARGLLAEVRERAYALRDRIDAHNRGAGQPERTSPVVFYAGQHVRHDDGA